MNGTKQIAQRIINAEESFVDAVVDQFGKSRDEALKVLSVFKKHKIVKIDPIVGQFNLKNGAFWDAQVIDNVLNA